jgi:Amidohydrolase family
MSVLFNHGIRAWNLQAQSDSIGATGCKTEEVPGRTELKVVFGTDAVAGAHGRNAEEFIDRERDCGVDPMAAMVSANSLGAEALGLGDQIGSIAPAYKRTSLRLMETRWKTSPPFGALCL